MRLANVALLVGTLGMATVAACLDPGAGDDEEYPVSPGAGGGVGAAGPGRGDTSTGSGSDSGSDTTPGPDGGGTTATPDASGSIDAVVGTPDAGFQPDVL